MMRNDIYIGNTDHDWFEFLASSGPHEQVNFWQPSRQHFKAIDEGGFFLFRRKAPINLIGGFGVLASAGTVTIRQAWRDLGQTNGTTSLEDFLDRVRKYRKTENIDDLYQIGFKIIVQPMFLPEEQWFSLPSDWSPNIVTGKGYSSASDEGARLHDEVMKRLSAENSNERAKALFGGLQDQPQAGYSALGARAVRIGQSAFRLCVLGAYGGACALTQTNVQLALEAAHITPFSESPNHSVQNGILLRRDLHALFDAHLISVSDQYCAMVSNRLKSQVVEGDPYLLLEGRKIRLPQHLCHWPCRGALAMHRDRMKELDKNQ
jgi:putative restriction endonuclease